VHDSSGAPWLVRYSMLIVGGSVIGYILGWFDRPRGTSKLQSLRHIPPPTAAERMLLDRHERIVQLVCDHGSTSIPGLYRPELEHRPILSMRVMFYESWPTRRLFPAGSKANTKRIWRNDINTGKDVIICPVDYGDLHLTRRELVFSGARRHREYPLDELTQLSATDCSIALATRRGRSMSYFEGVDTATVVNDMTPGDERPRPKLQAPLHYTGHDVQLLVRLLRSASILEPV